MNATSNQDLVKTKINYTLEAVEQETNELASFLITLKMYS